MLQYNFFKLRRLLTLWIMFSKDLKKSNTDKLHIDNIQTCTVGRNQGTKHSEAGP